MNRQTLDSWRDCESFVFPKCHIVQLLWIIKAWRTGILLFRTDASSMVVWRFKREWLGQHPSSARQCALAHFDSSNNALKPLKQRLIEGCQLILSIEARRLWPRNKNKVWHSARSIAKARKIHPQTSPIPSQDPNLGIRFLWQVE